jgi:hypothetical protein
MNSSVFRYVKYSPTFHRPESMREDLVWWRKILSFLHSTATKNQKYLLRSGSPEQFHDRSDQLAWHVKDRSTTQISIIHCQS